MESATGRTGTLTKAFDGMGGRWRAWSPLPLRLILGYGMAAHGFAKLVRGPEVFAGILDALQVPMPLFLSWATVISEVVCGVALMAGTCLSLAVPPLVVIMVVAALTVHLPYGFSSTKLLSVTAEGPQFGKPGTELNFLYIGGLLSLLLSGPGPLSFASLRRRGGKA